MTNTTEATKPTLLSALTSRTAALLSWLRSIELRDFAVRHRAALAVLGVLVVALAGYAFWPRTASTTMATVTTATPAAATPIWTRVCVGGVSYLRFPSGVSVEWTPAGRIRTCTEPR
jgi:hypothetical protein